MLQRVRGPWVPALRSNALLRVRDATVVAYRYRVSSALNCP